jgi:ferredoxin--NADP+ reductase/benzoate/toluate 1,2-dioxygenase reductase subunit
MMFQPGHHIDVGIAGHRVMRKYTVYSTLSDDFLEILVIVVDKGRLTPLLHRLKPGDELNVEGPTGQFLIPAKVRRNSKLLFVATGTGVSPFHCFARSYDDMDYLLLHGVRHREELYEHDVFELDRVVSCISREQGLSDDHTVFGHRVTDYLVDHPVDSTTHCYLCGNADMIRDVSEILQKQGIPPEQIYAEEYF